MTLLKRIRRLLRRVFRARTQSTQLLYEEILYLSGHIQSLGDLLVLFPQRICTTLGLASFHIFLREGADFHLQQPQQTASPSSQPHGDERAPTATFQATSSLAVRMRRDRKPALFNTPPAEPDGWQLLATPEELATLTALDTQVLLPLEGRTRLQGFVALARPAHKPFSKQDLRLLASLGPQIGRGLETALLVRSLSEQAVARASAQRELELAREVQERLLPRTLPTSAGYQAAALYRSAGPIGGDYYDLFPTPAGQLCLVIADVSGKGVPAALLMASLRASLHALLGAPAPSLTHALQSLNTLLYRSSSSARYATLFCALLDPETGRLQTVNAGHNAPLLLRSGQPALRLTVAVPSSAFYPAPTTKSSAKPSTPATPSSFTPMVLPKPRTPRPRNGVNHAFSSPHRPRSATRKQRRRPCSTVSSASSKTTPLPPLKTTTSPSSSFAASRSYFSGRPRCLHAVSTLLREQSRTGAALPLIGPAPAQKESQGTSCVCHLSPQTKHFRCAKQAALWRRELSFDNVSPQSL